MGTGHRNCWKQSPAAGAGVTGSTVSVRRASQSQHGTLLWALHCRPIPPQDHAQTTKSPKRGPNPTAQGLKCARACSGQVSTLLPLLEDCLPEGRPLRGHQTHTPTSLERQKPGLRKPVKSRVATDRAGAPVPQPHFCPQLLKGQGATGSGSAVAPSPHMALCPGSCFHKPSKPDIHSNQPPSLP